MIHNRKEIIKDSQIYLDDARVMIKEEKDLIPYYTHLVAMASYNKESGNIIHLSSNSFIDQEEREHLAWKIRDVITAFRKAKKEKVEVTLDYLKKQKFWWGGHDDFIFKALIDKIKNNTDIMKFHLAKDWRECEYFITQWIIPNYFDDIHDSMHNRYREEFVKFAKENGYKTFSFERNEFEDVGIYHPIIWKMCNDIHEYYSMYEKYAEVKGLK